MPTIIVDNEQAALMEVAFAMLEGALTARVARADPDKIISNSLLLQASKLATVRAHLRMPEPPAFSELPQSVQNAIHGCFQIMQTKPGTQEADNAYKRLREFVHSAGIMQPAASGHPAVQKV